MIIAESSKDFNPGDCSERLTLNYFEVQDSPTQATSKVLICCTE